jgi:hypothetical protein
MQVCDRIPEKFGLDPLTDVQVLAPRNTGSAGTSNLNEVLQARLNPPRDGVESVVRFGTIFRVGDKVSLSSSCSSVEMKHVFCVSVSTMPVCTFVCTSGCMPPASSV